MNKIDWKSKLSSRKFWASIAAFATAIMVVLNVPDLTQEQIIGLIGAIGSLVTYVVAEAVVDAKKVSNSVESDATAKVGGDVINGSDSQ